jgi:hypothetical protein
VSATFFPLPVLPKPRIARPIAGARAFVSRTLETGGRSARSGAEALADYWSTPTARDGERLAAKVLDALVLQSSTVCAGGAFLVASALMPHAAGLAFWLYVAGFCALTAFSLAFLTHLAREGEAVPAAALASRGASRRRKTVRARLRLLRRILRRASHAPRGGIQRPSLA